MKSKEDARLYMVTLRSKYGKTVRTSISGWSKEDAEARFYERYPQWQDFTIYEWRCDGSKVPEHWEGLPRALRDCP